MDVEQPVEVQCPTCGEETALWVDASTPGTTEQSSDCQVCCRPLSVTVQIRSGEASAVAVRAGW